MIVLNGRFAGRKAVVIRCFDDGHKDRKFGHALVAGLERAPRKVTKTMVKGNPKKAVSLRGAGAADTERGWGARWASPRIASD